MGLFIGIGVAWAVGMAGFIILNNRPGATKRRCNVKREVMQFRLINNQISTATKIKK